MMSTDDGQSVTNAAPVVLGNGNDESNSNTSDSNGGAPSNNLAVAASSSPSPSPPQRASRRVAAALGNSNSPVPPDNNNNSNAATTTAPSPNPPLAAAPSTLLTTTATNNNNPGGGAAIHHSSVLPKSRIVVARPPLNAYLKIAILRDDTDAVVCEDPERIGRKKRIVMTQLSSLEACSNNTNTTTTTADASSNKNVAAPTRTTTDTKTKEREQQKDEDEEDTHNSNNNNNKKEIPVPTISTIKRYDHDVPPNYSIPTSYIRYICPTYSQVMEESVEYNIDAEDEDWWRENRQFGPYAKATIIIMGEKVEDENVDVEKETNNDEGDPSSSEQQQQIDNHSTNINTNGIFAQVGEVNKNKVSEDKYGRKKLRKSIKSSSKSMLFEDSSTADDNNSMEMIGPTNSDISGLLPLPPSSAPAATTTSSSSSHFPPPQSSSSSSMTIEQALLLNPKYLYSSYSTKTLLQKYNPKLPLPIFERMMDTLEKATGFESIMTNSQAEQLLIHKIPQLIDIFGPLSAKDRRQIEEMEERYVDRWVKKKTNPHYSSSTTTFTETEVASPSSSPSVQQQPPPPPPSTTTSIIPVIAPPVTLPTVIRQVYNYWVAKRSKLRKPLLRRYWPPTMASDQNPHQVFRQRDKEKRRLRKKRQNDIEAYKKMKQLKLDFERVGVLCELIVKREEVNRNLVELTMDYFDARWNAWTDTTGGGGGSGVPTITRRRAALPNGGNRVVDMMEDTDILQYVPKYFDDGPILRYRGSKKRQRPTMAQQQMNGGGGGGWNHHAENGRELSPIPPPGCAVSSMGVGSLPPFPLPNNHNMAAVSSSMAGITTNNYLPQPQGIQPTPMLPGGVVVPPPPPPPKNVVVAGHDGGYPAPNFLQPLASRDSYPITHWDDATPSIPSYVNGQLTAQTDKFRHRPRLGRGGRIIIDRVPLPSAAAYNDYNSYNEGGPSPSPPTVITYGSPMKRSGYDIGTLGADGPYYSVNFNPPNKTTTTTTSLNHNNYVLYDAKSAPKTPPAKCLADLLPKSLGDTIALSRRIEEICALGLMEENHQIGSSFGGSSSAAGGGTGGAASVSVSSTSNGISASSSSSTTGAGVAAASASLSEEMDEILVPIQDWMEAPEALNLYGSEQFVIGPL